MQDIGNARYKEQVDEMKRLADLNTCMFCPDGLSIVNKKILHTGTYWFVSPNEYPYEGTSVHVMIIPKRHVEEITSLTIEELGELTTMISWVNENFSIKGATLFCRYGDTRYTSGTIKHLHLHIAQGEEKATSSKKITATIGFYE